MFAGNAAAFVIVNHLVLIRMCIGSDAVGAVAAGLGAGEARIGAGESGVGGKSAIGGTWSRR